ncbi:MAG: TonB family protein [Gemmatimonadaceae bacterium]
MTRMHPGPVALFVAVLSACASSGGPPRSRDGRPAPSYPMILLSAGIEGEVRLEATVDSLGRVIPASWRVRQSSHELFLLATKKAVRLWRFETAPGTTEVHITFAVAAKAKRCNPRVPAADSISPLTWYRYDRTKAHSYVYTCPMPPERRTLVHE